MSGALRAPTPVHATPGTIDADQDARIRRLRSQGLALAACLAIGGLLGGWYVARAQAVAPPVAAAPVAPVVHVAVPACPPAPACAACPACPAPQPMERHRR